MLQTELQPMLDEALPFRVVRTRSHDELRRRADECRRLAAAARMVNHARSFRIHDEVMRNPDFRDGIAFLVSIKQPEKRTA